MDEDLGEDDLIGKTTINLLPYFRHGFIDEWIKIFDPAKDWGDRDDMGEIRLIIDFKGPPGVRYVCSDRCLGSNSVFLCGCVGFQNMTHGRRLTMLTSRYPQRQDLVDTFDEKERTSYDDVIAKQLHKEAIEDQRKDEMRDMAIDAHYGVTDEFTDKEIFDAFRFIDLDKNMFIGFVFSAIVNVFGPETHYVWKLATDG